MKEVEAIEDIKNYGGALIAKKGRRGKILDDEKPLFGYARVLFDGNKIFRDVPCKALRKCNRNSPLPIQLT